MNSELSRFFPRISLSLIMAGIFSAGTLLGGAMLGGVLLGGSFIWESKPARAQEGQEGQKAQEPQEPQDIPVTCRVLAAHRPVAGVAYQPGVDVKGRRVVPADLGADPLPVPGESGSVLPAVIKVPLSVDLAQRLDNIDVRDMVMEGNLGVLEIHRDGRVLYNGRDWSGNVYAACGQELPDTISSQQEGLLQSNLPGIAPPQAGALLEGGEYREESYR